MPSAKVDRSFLFQISLEVASGKFGKEMKDQLSDELKAKGLSLDMVAAKLASNAQEAKAILEAQPSHSAPDDYRRAFLKTDLLGL